MCRIVVESLVKALLEIAGYPLPGSVEDRKRQLRRQVVDEEHEAERVANFYVRSYYGSCQNARV
jgi:hypothetical protein